MSPRKKVQSDTDAAKRRAKRRKLALVVGLARARRKMKAETSNKEAAKRRAKRRKLALLVGVARLRRKRRAA